jgi:hypothetical protein
MDWKITDISEITDIDKHKGFVRSKLVEFMVNGSIHTIKVSMPDFDKGRTNEIVQAEAKKIISAYTGK